MEEKGTIGEVLGEAMDDVMGERSADTSFVGTPIECEAYLRRLMGTMRNYLVGYTSDLVDGKYVPGERQESVLDAFDHSAWRVTVDPEDMISLHGREDVRDTVERIRLERDLFDALMSNVPSVKDGI